MASYFFKGQPVGFFMHLRPQIAPPKFLEEFSEFSEKLLALPGQDWAENITVALVRARDGEVILWGKVKEVCEPDPLHCYWQYPYWMRKREKVKKWTLAAALNDLMYWLLPWKFSQKLEPGAYELKVTLDTTNLPDDPRFLHIYREAKVEIRILRPTTRKERSLVHCSKAYYFAKKGEWEKAVREALKARFLYRTAPIHPLLAAYYLSQGRREEAIKELEEYTALVPVDPSACSTISPPFPFGNVRSMLWWLKGGLGGR